MTGGGNIFYVYEHLRPDTGQCFYVGKGKAKRAWDMRRSRNRHHAAIISKLTSIGTSVDVRIVVDGLSESAAFAVEVDRIAAYPKGQLANKDPGGRGAPSGRPLSSDHRKKISVANKGKKRSAETRARMSAAFSGRVMPDEVRKKISQKLKGSVPAFKGRKHSDQTKSRLSELGKLRGAPKLSAETIASIANFHLGRKRSAETRAKISAKAKGRPSRMKGKPSPLRGRSLSEETKNKMRVAMKDVWNRRRYGSLP